MTIFNTKEKQDDIKTKTGGYEVKEGLTKTMHFIHILGKICNFIQKNRHLKHD